jgi:hypothetical protein
MGEIHKRVPGMAFSLMETVVGAALFSLITVCGLAVWTNYARQQELAQMGMLMSAFCQMDLESSMAVGYHGVVPVARTGVVVDSNWTDVTTGQTQPIEPSVAFEYERQVTVPEDGLKQVRVTVYYQSKTGEKKVSLATLLYRSN